MQFVSYTPWNEKQLEVQSTRTIVITFLCNGGGHHLRPRWHAEALGLHLLSLAL